MPSPRYISDQGLTIAAIEEIGKQITGIHVSTNKVSEYLIRIDTRLETVEETQHEVLKHQKYTNGRVTELERDKIVRDTQLTMYKSISMWVSGIGASVVASIAVYLIVR